MVQGPSVSLPPRQLFERPDAASARILCTAGCLWVTIDHDPRDVVLHPGESFEGTAGRRALVYALEPSAFVLAPASQRAIGHAHGRARARRTAFVWGCA